MIIKADTVVSIHYTLKDDAGEILDSSRDSDPLEYLHGHMNIVPGLEKALEGLEIGATKDVVVSPEEGYGPVMPEAVQKVPQADFPEDIPREVGLQVMAEGPGGQPFPLWITAVDDDHVTVDGNHPLAGKNLNFAVEVVDVRAATADELAHGHAHGPGGHQH